MIRRMLAETSYDNKEQFRAGVAKTLPMGLGAIPFGLAYGVLAVQSGLTIPETAFMSLIVFAGAAQFMALGMIQAALAHPVIILSTLLINLRHAVMGLSLSPYLSETSPAWHRVLAFGMTDETYVAAITHYREQRTGQGNPYFMLGSFMTLYILWNTLTLIGAVASSSISNPLEWGIDFAMPATFITMLMGQIISKRLVLVAATSGAAATISYALIPGKWYIIIATVIACLVGLGLEWLSEQAEARGELR